MREVFDRCAPLCALVFSIACEESTPADAFAEMRKAACSGDQKAFFDHIDRTSIVDGVVREAVSRNSSLSPDLVRSGARKAIYEGLDTWADDIKHKEASDFCQTREVRWTGFDWVAWVDGSGVSRRARFSKAGDSWVMVELSAAD